MNNLCEVHRPRNMDWTRASAMLYGDWGTSKAYVIGLAFPLAGYSSLPIIAAICLLTAVVGVAYALVCRYFPDGGGVYSSAKSQGPLLAVIGALLLAAGLMVTASLSAYEAFKYLGVPADWVVPISCVAILTLGIVNYFGPRHSGNLAKILALPTIAIVLIMVGVCTPSLTTVYLEPLHESPFQVWTSFVGMILALSGVESIASMTGVMKLDKGATEEKPCVARGAAKAILPVALETTVATFILGWAMLSIPKSLTPEIALHTDDMLRYIGQYYATDLFGASTGQAFGWLIGIVFGFLLLSAVNTAIAALIGLLFTMARDHELPESFLGLNSYGVPKKCAIASTLLPIIILLICRNLETLAGLYAIGVVSAIALNLGSCAMNKGLSMAWPARLLMSVTAVGLSAATVTLAYTKHEALFFIVVVLTLGLSLRSYAQRCMGLQTITVTNQVAHFVTTHLSDNLNVERPDDRAPVLLVAARGLNPVLRYALDEARLRRAKLHVLYVREVAVWLHHYVSYAPAANWQNDTHAAPIMNQMIALGRQEGVEVVPEYGVSLSAPSAIVSVASKIGADFVILGASNRSNLDRFLRGNVATEVARNLPAQVKLIIYG